MPLVCVLSLLGLVSEPTRQVASPGKVGKPASGPDALYAAAASIGLRCIRFARGSLAVTAAAERAAR